MKSLLLLLLLGLSVPAASQGSVEDWRKEREKQLRSEQGWLSLVALLWLQPGNNEVGQSKALQLPDGAAKDATGTFFLNNAQVEFQPDSPAFLLNNKPLRLRTALRPDTEKNPDTLKTGRLTLNLIKRGKTFAIRIKDPQSPARAQLPPLRWFPVQDAFSAGGQFTPYAKPRKELITNAQEMKVSEDFVGTVTFNLGGKSYRLAAQGKPSEGLFIVFRDQTTGKTTYGAGRFLDTLPVAADGSVLLNFNKAYNPPCAVTRFATCPRPLPENNLETSITAGEKL